MKLPTSLALAGAAAAAGLLLLQPTASQAQAEAFSKIAGAELTDISFEEARLDDLLVWLSRMTDRVDGEGGNGIQFVVLDDEDSSLSARPITLNLARMPVAQLLGYIVDLAGASFAIEEHAVVVGSHARITAEGPDAAVAISRSPGAAAQFRKLSELRLPQIEWHEASLGEVAGVLRSMSARGEGARRPLNVVLNAEDQEEFASQTVSLDLRKVSGKIALDYVCRQLGCGYYLDDHGVVLAPLDRIPPDPVRIWALDRQQGSHAALHLPIEEIDMSGVTVGEAVELVRGLAEAGGKPLNIIDGNVAPDAADTAEADDPWEQRFDLTLSNVRLGTVLDYVCMLGGGRYETGPLAVMVTEAPEPEPEKVAKPERPRPFDPFAEEEEESFFSVRPSLAGPADKGLFARE